MGNRGHKPNPWKGAITGVIGSIAGLLAMRFYWNQVAPIFAGQESGAQGDSGQHQSHALDDISVVGQHHHGDESSTAALGRISYTELTGKPLKSRETKTVLSYLVHWAYGMFMGGVYGALYPSVKGMGLQSGILFAGGLWLLGDELAVPMLGLQSGPTAVSFADHFNRLGAHLSYGVTTAATSHLLRKLL